MPKNISFRRKYWHIHDVGPRRSVFRRPASNAPISGNSKTTMLYSGPLITPSPHPADCTPLNLRCSSIVHVKRKKPASLLPPVFSPFSFPRPYWIYCHWEKCIRVIQRPHTTAGLHERKKKRVFMLCLARRRAAGHCRRVMEKEKGNTPDKDDRQRRGCSQMNAWTSKRLPGNGFMCVCLVFFFDDFGWCLINFDR